jgi:chromate reductase
MPILLGISGSLRRDSVNTKLLRAAATLVPEGTRLDIGSIEGIPLYNADVEAQGTPPAVAALKDAIASADGLLLVTPEYNHSMPGVLKNAVDWLSRPPSDIRRVFRGRPVAVMGATPGMGATISAQAAWLPVLRALGTLPWFGGRLIVPGAPKAFDDEGRLVDEELRGRVESFVRGFAEFSARHSPRHDG